MRSVKCVPGAGKSRSVAFDSSQIDAPHTQVMTAMAFLKERGCIVPARERRHRAASDFVYEDALIEWHALREGAPGSSPGNR